MEPSSSFFIQNMISETNKSKLLQIANRLPIIEKIADRLPGWKTDLLTKAGRNILVQSVLTSMLIYLLLALDLPAKALEAIDKIRRGFLWKGRKDVRGGHC